MNNELIEIAADKCIQINDEGIPVFEGQPITDPNFLTEFYKGLRRKDHFFVSKIHNKEFLIEPYDQIFVVSNLEFGEDISFKPVETQVETIDLFSLSLDDWDRLHGRTKTDLPFVLSRQAQEQIFDNCEFDDDSMTYHDVRYETPYIYQAKSEVSQSQWWSAKYKENPHPGWQLEAHHPLLQQAVRTLKLQKSKILVLGCGTGNDAAYLASLGHIVTAVDFSPVAIAKAQKTHGETDHLKWLQADYFENKEEFKNKFDIVFDHTNYSAIDPKRRGELAKLWRTSLREGGHLLGIFFSFDKREGPPFGGSEFELSKRIDKHFRLLYWNRGRVAPSFNRYGIEFVVWAEKLRL